MKKPQTSGYTSQRETKQQRERNLVANRVIDMELQSQIEKEKQKLRDILTLIFYCMKFLATQSLTLQGHRD